MIRRDEHGLIVQHPTMDGGDSAARTGIAALSSAEDKDALAEFLTVEDARVKLIRHPIQPEWNDSKKTSRDQLVQFCVSEDEFTQVCARSYAQDWFINKDFLSPAVRLYLYKCADEEPPAWLTRLGLLEMKASMHWNTKVKPNEEMNQFACMCIRFGPEWAKALIEKHPDIKFNIRKYWSGWRDQAEIGEILLGKLYQVAGL